MFEWYRFFQGRKILSGCVYCDGAIYIHTSVSHFGEEEVIKCFHCGRMFRYEKGRLILWPFREYPHLEKYEAFKDQGRFAPR